MATDREDGPLAFPDTDAALHTIVDLCRSADWETLSRYYDRSESHLDRPAVRAALADRDADDDLDRVWYPPFPTGDYRQRLGPVTKRPYDERDEAVIVSYFFELRWDDETVWRGSDAFALREGPDGWRLLPDVVADRTVRIGTVPQSVQAFISPVETPSFVTSCLRTHRAREDGTVVPGRSSWTRLAGFFDLPTPEPLSDSAIEHMLELGVSGVRRPDPDTVVSHWLSELPDPSSGRVNGSRGTRSTDILFHYRWYDGPRFEYLYHDIDGDTATVVSDCRWDAELEKDRAKRERRHGRVTFEMRLVDPPKLNPEDPHRWKITPEPVDVVTEWTTRAFRSPEEATRIISNLLATHFRDVNGDHHERDGGPAWSQLAAYFDGTSGAGDGRGDRRGIVSRWLSNLADGPVGGRDVDRWFGTYDGPHLGYNDEAVDGEEAIVVADGRWLPDVALDDRGRAPSNPVDREYHRERVSFKLHRVDPEWVYGDGWRLLPEPIQRLGDGAASPTS